jgi:hypothetical protein
VIPHGDADALLIAARQMDVDILLWGGTHKFEAYELEGKFFVNPGSATGAFSTSWLAIEEEPIPSFCLMDVSVSHDVFWPAQLLTMHRSRVMSSYYTSTSCAKTTMETRMSRWKRSHSESQPRQSNRKILSQSYV